jgi:ABC-type glycerol-3-phosphate transport system substrate-binding protein
LFKPNASLRFSVLAIVGMVILASCSNTEAPAQQSQQSTVTAAPTITPRVAPATATTQPTLEPVDELIRLRIWVPDRLAPLDDTALLSVLQAEANEFVTSENNVQIEIRRKRSQDIGGIMSTLRSAASVAPGALPDLTLMRRSDLMTAVSDNLIHPLEGRIASAVIADLFPAALRLGRAEDQLYGLPYLMELYLMAYRSDPGEDMPAVWTFDDMVEQGMVFAFPAARTNGISDVLWLQYLSAGGSLPTADGQLTFSPGALSAVLGFYEQLNDERLIAPGITDYETVSEYLPLLIDGRLPSAVINTSSLRALADSDQQLAFAAVPTFNGESITLADSWMWVLVTNDPQQQAVAGRFLNWMMDSGRHSSYAQVLMMPPSQRSSLRRWQIDLVETGLITQLMNGALNTQPEISALSRARALQAALIDVLTGNATATEATAALLEQ